MAGTVACGLTETSRSVTDRLSCLSKSISQCRIDSGIALSRIVGEEPPPAEGGQLVTASINCWLDECESLIRGVTENIQSINGKL
jgi:hypothetical protein